MELHENEDRARRARGRRQCKNSELDYFDILFCETLVCLVIAIALVLLRYVESSLFQDVVYYIGSYQSITLSKIFDTILSIFI